MKKQRINFIVYFLPIFFSTYGLYAQKEAHEYISKQEYKVMNDFFTAIKTDGQIQVYHKTYFDKGWKIFFNDPNLSLIKSEVGIPMRIPKDALDSILTKSKLGKIENRISISRPLRIEKRRISKNVELVDSFDGKNDSHVMRIIEPIIVDDIAIFRTISINEAPIYIMRIANGKWEVIYTFNEWRIIE